MHLVRNSCDHGIEPPEDRTARGQAAAGQAHAARLSRGRPGQHRDRRRRRRASTSRGSSRRPSRKAFCGPNRPRELSDREALNLIFLPGFSTAPDCHQRLRARRRHGRGQVQHREDRRRGRYLEPARRGHHGQAEDSADAGHHSRPGGHQRRRAVRHSPGQPARIDPARRRFSREAHRADPRNAGLSPARQVCCRSPI